MDAFGLPEELRDRIRQDVPEAPQNFTVMPENAQAFDVFIRCQTQWRHSFSGVTGLDYTALIQVIRVCIPKKQRNQIFDDVRLIESGALRAISKRRESNG